MSVWLILGIVLGVVLLLCGIGGGAIVVGLVLPAAQRVKAKQAEIQAEQEKAQTELEGSSRQPQNNRLTANNVAKVQAGFTQAHVEELLGVGSPASIPIVSTVVSPQPNGLEAHERWQAAHRVGKVYVWRNRDDWVLVAYDRTPTGERVVIGLISLMGGEGREPIPLPTDKP